MMRMKAKLRNFLYSRWPYAQIIWVRLNRVIGRSRTTPPLFSGWGMTTSTFTPWNNGGGDDVAVGFLRTHETLINRLRGGKFTLSQFGDEINKESILRQLMWRHYIIYWSASYAAKATNCSCKNLVECGVCDGTGIFFAINALRANNLKFKCFLYDAWESMRADYLLESEKHHAGSYSYLQVEQTRENLIEYDDHTVLNKGFIPESFENSSNPDELVWLHIDLNSSLPTESALKFFFEKIPKGGVVLFDDYAWPDWHDTKNVVDRFFADKPGLLLPLPTGQSIFFKYLD